MDIAKKNGTFWGWVGAFAFLFPYIFPFLKWAEKVVGWGGSIDFLISRSEEPDWVGAVLETLLAPPLWLQFSFFLFTLFAVSKFLSASIQRQIEERVPVPATLTADAIQSVIDDEGIVIDGGTFDTEAEERSLIYVGSATVNIARMNEDNRAEIAIIAFNGNDFPVKITAPNNHIRMSYKTSESETANEMLPTPTLLTDRGPMFASPRSEFMVVLHQYLTPVQIRAISEGLKWGTVTFDIRDFILFLEKEGDPNQKLKLILTKSPNITKCVKGEIRSNYTVYMAVSSNVKALDF